MSQNLLVFDSYVSSAAGGEQYAEERRIGRERRER